jgi:hypothetical protein
MNPWNITADLTLLNELIDQQLEQTEGEITDDIKQMISHQQRLIMEVDLEGVAMLIRKRKAEHALLKAQAEAFNRAAERESKAVQRLQELVIAVLEAKGVKKTGSFSICKNGGLAPIEFVGKATEDFIRYEPKVDLGKVRQSLEQGNDLSFAKLKERGQHLRVKATIGKEIA